MFTSPMNHQLVQSKATVAHTASRCCQQALHPLPSWGGQAEVGQGVGGGGGGRTTWRRGHGSTCSLYWSVPTSVENLTPLSNACELEVAMWCLWCILYFNTNLPLFLLVYCVAACMWMIHDCIFLEKILNIFIPTSTNASKIKFDRHCVVRLGIRKKHAKTLRDLLRNLWAV